MKSIKIEEIMRIIAGMNRFLNETNECGQIIYVGVASTGEDYCISYLGLQLWNSDEDSFDDEDYAVHPGPHADGLTEAGKILEQLLWNKIAEIHDDLEKASKFIHAMTSTGRGINA